MTKMAASHGTEEKTGELGTNNYVFWPGSDKYHFHIHCSGVI